MEELLDAVIGDVSVAPGELVILPEDTELEEEPPCWELLKTMVVVNGTVTTDVTRVVRVPTSVVSMLVLLLL